MVNNGVKNGVSLYGLSQEKKFHFKNIRLTTALTMISDLLNNFHRETSTGFLTCDLLIKISITHNALQVKQVNHQSKSASVDFF